MPLFDGKNPDGWLLQIERYFNFYRLTEDERLEAVALERDALRWFQSENKRHLIRMWEDLKGLRQFKQFNGGSLYEQWLATTQTTTVSDYRRKFIETAAPVDRVPENILLGQFLNGLIEEVKAEVHLLNPISLEQAMEFAMRVEEKNHVTGSKKSRRGEGGFKSGSCSVSFKNPIQSGSFLYNHQQSPTKSFLYKSSTNPNSNTQLGLSGC